MTGAPAAAFQRARTEEQRAARRLAILQTAATMLTEMPVADISLNGLSRRVGIAKSNVLRYFESREAVLLELLNTAWRDWLSYLALRIPAAVDPSAPLTARCEQLAQTITQSLAAHPQLCELISASAAVLERNISADVARRFKTTALENTVTLACLIQIRLSELRDPTAERLARTTFLVTGATWIMAHPSASMIAANQSLAVSPVDFSVSLSEILADLLAGAIARSPD